MGFFVILFLVLAFVGLLVLLLVKADYALCIRDHAKQYTADEVDGFIRRCEDRLDSFDDALMYLDSETYETINGTLDLLEFWKDVRECKLKKLTSVQNSNKKSCNK